MKKIFGNNFIKILAAGSLILIFSSACATPTPVVQTVEVTRLVPQVVIATFIVRETVVPTSETTTPPVTVLEQTPTPIPTTTPTATTESRFPNAKLNSFGFRSDGKFFVTVDAGQKLTGEYKARLDKVDYECVIAAKYPERLYCFGNLDRHGIIVQYQIFSADASRALVFETEFTAPEVPTVTPTPTATATETPEPTATP